MNELAMLLGPWSLPVGYLLLALEYMGHGHGVPNVLAPGCCCIMLRIASHRILSCYATLHAPVVK
jgi:hypothetical protein